MGITERFFQFGSELNVIHLPYRPNGFCIFILGDRTHFVSRDSSFWLEHEGRNQLLNTMLDRGYTIFNSNLYGRHLGFGKSRPLRQTADSLCAETRNPQSENTLARRRHGRPHRRSIAAVFTGAYPFSRNVRSLS